MAGELNTEVLDDPASCRTTADWLGQVKPGVVRIGDALHEQRGASESFWRGTAGDAARQTLTYQGKDADTLEGLVGQVKTALEVFAGEIDTVNQRMHQARTVARDGKLIVTPTTILPPGPAPKGAGSENLPPTPMGQRIEAHQGQSQASQAAMADYEAKKRAFQEAQTTIQDARTRQEKAHLALEKAMKDPLDTVKTTKTYAMFAVGHGLSYIKTAHSTSASWVAHAEKLDDAAEAMQTRAANSPSPAMRELGERAAARGTETATDARTRASRSLGPAEKVPSKARDLVSRNPSGLVKGGSMVSRASRSVLRGVPYVGTTLTIGSGVTDVMMGKNVGEAVEDTSANLGGSVAGGMAGAALGSAIFPGVGTVIGGVAGGIAGSLGATSLVDWATGE